MRSKFLKKLLAGVTTLAMAAQLAVIPMTAQAAEYFNHDYETGGSGTDTDWKSPNGTVTVQTNGPKGIGSYLRVAQSGGESRNGYMQFPASAQRSGECVIEFDFYLSATNERATQLFVYGAGQSISNNAPLTSGYVLRFDQPVNTDEFAVNMVGGGGNTLPATDPSYADAAAKSTGYTRGTWAHSKAILDFDAKTAEVSVTALDGEEEFYKGRVDMDPSVTALGGINILAPRSGGTIGIDNIVVRDRDASDVTEIYYDVIYDVQGVQTGESVLSGSNVVNIPNTDIPGQVFIGWKVNDNEILLSTEELAALAIEENITAVAQYEVDENYIEPIVSAEITGPSSMAFGPDSDTPISNDYTLTLTGEKGTIITADTADPRVRDFNIEWTLSGFKTENDTENQYCDSYGEFAEYSDTATNISFLLKQVSFNFYGTLSAKVTYNNSEISASMPVVALGDLSAPATQIAPDGGYPTDFDVYDDSLVGYTVSVSPDNQTGEDIITGGMFTVGSDSTKNGVLSQDETGKYIRVSKGTSGKSGMMTKPISMSAGQIIIEQDIRFNSAGGCVTLTKGYPIWSSAGSYAAIADITYEDSNLTMVGQPIMSGDNAVNVSVGTWYKVVFSIDTTSGKGWAKLYDSSGDDLLGEVSNVKLSSTDLPTYYSVGLGNSYTGSTDLGGYRIYTPTADINQFTLTASQDTLSIPNGDTAELSASLTTAEGYEILADAEWSVLESDMQGVIVTADPSNSHRATVTLSADAQPGTATVQVSMGGYVKTIVLNITSSAENIKFTQNPPSISIPIDASSVSTAVYEACVADGNGVEIEGREVTYALYDRNNINPYIPGEGITFDPETATITVTSTALPATFCIRATGFNTDGEPISRAVTVTVHGLSFDLGSGDEGSLVEGYTEVTSSTYYSDALGFGIEGTAVAGGTASDTDAASDYLEGTFVFKAKVTPGELYRVTVDFAGDLVTEYHDSVIAGHTRTLEADSTTYTGYTIRTEEIAQQVYDIPVVDDVLDLNFTNAQVAAIQIEKVSREATEKPTVYSIGDSTLGNNGSYGYVLARDQENYPELTSLITRYNNNGKASRTLSTYVTQGWLDSVLASIKPGDVVTIGNMGTNTGGLTGTAFKAPLDYYVDACLTMGAKVILTSYTPHGGANYYDSETHTFNGWRQDDYDALGIRVIYEERKDDPNILGFIEIGKNADAAFNAYVADYAANGHASADEAAQAIISCFSDHNHYSGLASTLMIEGYGDVDGIVAQLVDILSTPDEPVETGASASYDGATATVQFKNLDGTNAVIYVAEYADDGTLKAVKKSEVTVSGTDATETVSYTAENADNVKVFVWTDRQVKIPEL